MRAQPRPGHCSTLPFILVTAEGLKASWRKSGQGCGQGCGQGRAWTKPGREAAGPGGSEAVDRRGGRAQAAEGLGRQLGNSELILQAEGLARSLRAGRAGPHLGPKGRWAHQQQPGRPGWGESEPTACRLEGQEAAEPSPGHLCPGFRQARPGPRSGLGSTSAHLGGQGMELGVWAQS